MATTSPQPPDTPLQQLEKTLEKLSPEQQREVIDFAAFLATRHADAERASVGDGERRIRFGSWVGCLGHVDQSAVDLMHDTMKHWAKHTEGEGS